ncbi:MAG TPA: NfeD family protein [Stellaceae bacterium]|nr:NfeD family protein [Stellaceae bacterium]
MRAEYWLLAALALAIAEVVNPGIFLIFFAAGAAAAAGGSLLVPGLVGQLGVFVAASVIALLAGTSLYRRLLDRRGIEALGHGPVGEPGTVEEAIVNGRGKVRVRGIAWLATGPDLPAGTAITVVGRDGTLLEVARRPPAA